MVVAKRSKRRKSSESKAAFIERWSTLPFLNIHDTARAVGLAPKTVYEWNNRDPDFVRACAAGRQATLHEIKERGLIRFTTLLDDALGTEAHLVVHAQSENVRHAAAVEIFDRVYGRATQTTKNEQSGLVAHAYMDMSGFTDDELRDIVKRVAGGSARSA